MGHKLRISKHPATPPTYSLHFVHLSQNLLLGVHNTVHFLLLDLKEGKQTSQLSHWHHTGAQGAAALFSSLLSAPLPPPPSAGWQRTCPCCPGTPTPLLEISSVSEETYLLCSSRIMSNWRFSCLISRWIRFCPSKICLSSRSPTLSNTSSAEKEITNWN